MNYAVLLALLFQVFTVPIQQPAVTKSDMPPSISVKMSPDEEKKLDDAQKAIDVAESALESAKHVKDQLTYDTILRHRGADLPNADCNFGNGGWITWYAAVPPEPKGYIGSIHGRWVVFTREFLKCHGG